MGPLDLRGRRSTLGLTQDQLGGRFGVSQSYVSHAETREDYARPWYDLALRCMEYEARIEKLPRKRKQPSTARVIDQ